MDKSNYRIPRFLDYPNLYPIWTLGETLLISLPSILGWLILKSALGFVLGASLGATFFKNFRQFKNNYGEHILIRICYWYLPNEFLGLKSFPPSHIREYVG